MRSSVQPLPCLLASFCLVVREICCLLSQCPLSARMKPSAQRAAPCEVPCMNCSPLRCDGNNLPLDIPAACQHEELVRKTPHDSPHVTRHLFRQSIGVDHARPSAAAQTLDERCCGGFSAPTPSSQLFSKSSGSGSSRASGSGSIRVSVWCLTWERAAWDVRSR